MKSGAKTTGGRNARKRSVLQNKIRTNVVNARGVKNIDKRTHPDKIRKFLTDCALVAAAPREM